MKINNNKYFTYLKKQFYKFVVILVIFGLNGPELFTIGYTSAYYNDTETSNNNIFTAGELDFILNEGEWTPTGGEVDLEAGESVSRTITILEDLTIGPSIDFKYIVTPVKTSGDNDFCGALQLEASLDGVSEYSGPLFSFISDVTTFDVNHDDWIFNVSLPDGSPEFVDKACHFDFVFSGWQIQFPNEGEGYNDVEHSSNIIASPGAPFNPNVCPFEEGPGKQIIYFNNQVLRSDATLADANDGPIVGFIPAGTYDITLASYDEHLSKPAQIQPNEQWKLIMQNALGDDVAITTPIRDIVDGVEEQVVEKVEDDFSISEDINLFTASHSAYPDTLSANSLKALCAMFEGEGLEDISPLLAPPSDRTDDGLLALYTFEENSGQVVNDVSGVGAPLNLFIPDLSKISRVAGGLSIDSSTLISSFVPALKLTNGLKATNEITIEAWIKAENTSQGGPARIATLSKDTSFRNFTLGQEADKYVGRLRTPATGLNGATPAPVSTPSGTVNTELQHVVYTRTPDTAKIYIDGVEVVSQTITGDFSNWDSSFRFGLANEFTIERTWLGDLHLVAIYDRDLSPSEIAQNFNAGADMMETADTLMMRMDLVELYSASDTTTKDEKITATEELIVNEPVVLEEQEEEITDTEVAKVEEPVIEEMKEEEVLEEPKETKELEEEVAEAPVMVPEILVIEEVLVVPPVVSE